MLEVVTLFTAVCLAMPEYVDPASAMKQGMVLGGFAALGNPSSFHNELVRMLRLHMMGEAMDLFRDYLATAKLPKGYKIEQLPDRMLLRPAGQQPTAESWHRDETPRKKLPEDEGCDEKDIIFGGWLNLDPVGSDPQAFSCVVGTHNDARGKAGFAKFSKEQVAEHKFKERKETTLVHPGEWIVFNQNIVHEVVAVKHKTEQRRLFFGWRLTMSDTPLWHDTRATMVAQGVPRLPSGQKPGMYAALHWVNWVDRLHEWSQKTFIPELLYLNDKPRDDKTVCVIERFLPDLAHLGLQPYEDYSAEELAIFTPKAVHKCKAMGFEEFVDVEL